MVLRARVSLIRFWVGQGVPAGVLRAGVSLIRFWVGQGAPAGVLRARVSLMRSDDSSAPCGHLE